MSKLTKEDFVSIIDSLQQANNLQDSIHKLITKSDNINIDSMRGTGFMISHEPIVVRLLKLLMNDACDWISYYIYELDYGSKYTDGSITDADRHIDISSSERLYDFLVEVYGA